MPETENAKAERLQKRREKQRAKRERTGDTPEAAAERAAKAKQYDDRAAKKRVGTGVIFS
jgi:hypothetical protein